MNTKKNIDKLFQEQLSEHEVLPPNMVWNNIEEKLKEKKKRRVIPFWWKLSGVAALFVIGLGFYNWQFNDSKTTISNENAIVNENTIDNVKSKNNQNNLNSSRDLNATKNLNENSKLSPDAEVLVNNENEKSAKKEKKDSGLGNNSSKENDNIVSIESTSNISERKSKNNYNQEINKKSTSNSKLNSKLNSNSGIAKNNNDSNQEKSSEKINSFEKISNQEKQNNPIADTNKNNTNTKDKSTTNAIVGNNKSEINSSKNDIKLEEINKIDSTKVAAVEPNALEELLKEKEKEITKKEPKLNRWQLTPNVAPIYFSSTSNGSPLDSKLSTNAKEYSTNYSYGLGVNYALNKKIKIRSGVNVFSVGYNTTGISFEQTTKSSRMENINPTAQGAFIQIKPVGVSTATIYSRSTNAQAANEVFSNKFEGSINQRFGYFEMPLELSYKIIDKKIGVEFIGGMSTLFLNQNEVLLNSSNMNLKIGEANNLNQIHFSGNLGLGLKYSFWKKLDARIEPVFKYQIRTFTNDVGDFKPYVFGVYSGVSYTF
jgi:hypothetical protein